MSAVDFERIKRLVEEGRSLNSLARETGIPRYMLARELKLKFGVSSGVVIRETKRRRDEAIVQYRRRRPDATCCEIGKLFGCAESTVAKALAAANGKRTPFDIEPIKRTMRERPFMRTDDLCRAFGVSGFLVNQARQELTDEGFDVALEREILAEEILRENPDASVAEIAEFFKTSKQIVTRAIHGTTKLDRDEILEESLRSRAVKGPRWYRAEMARKSLQGMKLPPEMFERYLKIYKTKVSRQ